MLTLRHNTPSFLMMMLCMIFSTPLAVASEMASGDESSTEEWDVYTVLAIVILVLLGVLLTWRVLSNYIRCQIMLEEEPEKTVEVCPVVSRTSVIAPPAQPLKTTDRV